MKNAPVRKMVALVFAVFLAAGSLAAAGGAKSFGSIVNTDDLALIAAQ